MNYWVKLENTDSGAVKGFCIGLGIGALAGCVFPFGLFIGVCAGMTLGTTIGALIGLYRDYKDIHKDLRGNQI